jgi:hypothetical protein
MKKFIVAVLVTLFSITSLAFIAPTPTVKAASCDTDGNFLSFPTWYRGLCDGSGQLKNDMFEGQEPGPIVFTIALNILDIALRLAGILAVGFVIWGGFQYIIARGEPEHAKKALDTILKAVIGMVIAMIAAFAVSFVVGRLGA